jgi:large subunit ribosomal protein L6
MSRVGKVSIEVPSGVQVDIKGLNVEIIGPKGRLFRSFVADVDLVRDNNFIKVVPLNDKRDTLKMWGTVRSILQNMISGVSIGFKTELQLIGVGYRASSKDQYLNLSLGKSHSTKIFIPNYITVDASKPSAILLESIDKEKLGQFTSIIIKQRPPEPYKGKGIRIKDSFVQRKEVKKKK